MKIMQTVKKIPGGLMIVPLMLGVIANTFFPQFFTYFDGTFTSHLWKTGAMPILAVFLFCNGATINFREAGLTLSSFVVAGIPGVLLGILSTLITGTMGYIVYRLLKMKAPCLGSAIGTTAGNAAATPAALATAGVISTQISDIATAQVSAAIIVTAILCPLMVTLLSKREKAN